MFRRQIEMRTHIAFAETGTGERELNGRRSSATRYTRQSIDLAQLGIGRGDVLALALHFKTRGHLPGEGCRYQNRVLAGRQQVYQHDDFSHTPHSLKKRHQIAVQATKSASG